MTTNHSTRAPLAEGGDPSRIPELDGIRGIAILLVLLFHTYNRLFNFGWMGVDLFFVLSGFLITQGLVKTAGRPNYFRNFYARRALRIWPLYYLLLAYVFLFLPVVGWEEHPSVSVWLPYALYLQNLDHPLSSKWALGPTWSLAVEEHFYLIWPLVVFLLPRRKLNSVALGAVVAAPIFRLMVAAMKVSPWVTFFSTPCRIDGLALGALMSLALTGTQRERDTVRRFAPSVALAGALVSVPLAMWLGSDVVNGSLPTQHPIARAGLFSIVAFTSAGFIGSSMTASRGVMTALLRTACLRYCGKVSYGIYIYHTVVLQAVSLQIAHLGFNLESPPVKLIQHVTCMTLTFVVASISWYGLERPILRLKRVFSGE